MIVLITLTFQIINIQIIISKRKIKIAFKIAYKKSHRLIKKLIRKLQSYNN